MALPRGTPAHNARILPVTDPDSVKPIESEPDLERYLRALDAFGEVAAGRECRYCSTSSRLTFGIRGEAAGQTTRGEDASERIAVLHARLDALNPSGLFGAR